MIDSLKATIALAACIAAGVSAYPGYEDYHVSELFSVLNLIFLFFK